ncbi:hypothetical protein EGW08_017885, partial [Elysia chlorotica]
YFSVLARAGGEADPAQATSVGGNHGDAGEHATRQPPYIVSETPRTPQDGTDHTDDGRPEPELASSKVTRFQAFWHPGDSRIFTAAFGNGSSIEVYGPKKSDGTIRSIYSLVLRDSESKSPATNSVVRFQGGLNIASVVLSNGVVVNYDWSVDKQHLEVQVFEPHTAKTQGPISHLAKVANINLHPLPSLHAQLAQVPGLSALSASGGRARLSPHCFSRFPVTVKKCGGAFPYSGAYVQGEVLGLGSPVSMAALPWPREGHDPCYAQDAGSDFNYYLPLPGAVDSENATMIQEAFVASSAKIFAALSHGFRSLGPQVHHKVCSDVAEQVRADLNAHHMLDTVLFSCSAMLNSLYTMVTAVRDVAAAENVHASQETATLRAFQRRMSDSFPRDLPDTVQVKAHAFCPSAQPQSSFQKTVSTRAIRGHVVQDEIQIDCGAYPEVTYVDMNHMLALTADHYDVIKYKVRVCSICTFNMAVSAQIVQEELLCNDTCTKRTSQARHRTAHSTERVTFTQQDSVYCQDFLTAETNSILQPIGRDCLANCMSDLKVQLSIRDPARNVSFYDQSVKCSELQRSRCTMKFGM